MDSLNNMDNVYKINVDSLCSMPSHLAKLGEITGKTRVLYSKVGEITGKTRVLPGGI